MTAAAEPVPRKKRRWWPLLVLPYLLGIAWTCVHPILSVVTGEAKCRGWFIDESALETGSLNVHIKYSTRTEQGQGSTSLCESLLSARDIRDNVVCIRSIRGLEVAKIVPISNAVAPTAETIVIVVPGTENWSASDFHNALLQLMTRLSQSSSCPWLAKTVMVVSPSDKDMTLDSAVSTFLDAYLGDVSSQISTTELEETLPIDYTTGILRNLLVVDVHMNDTVANNELRILPQGRHGVLPNMDLVYSVFSIYSRSMSRGDMIMHSYGDVSRKLKGRIPSWLPPAVQAWVYELGNMMLFSYNLAMGPYPPHFHALNKGIDAITLQGDLSRQSAVVDVVQKLEILLRSLSNLHERLHHSITQYLLPSPAKFVSHVEYLLPNILILLPLVIRAVLLVFVVMTGPLDVRFCFQRVLLVGLCSLVLYVTSHRTDTTVMNTLYSLLYIGVCLGGMDVFLTAKCSERQTQSLQFAVCLVAIYLHVPLAFAHVSLAFPSALLWTPLIAFPAFSIQNKVWQRIKRPVMFAVGLSLPLVVSTRVFGGYTPFVTTVFLPLHMLVSLLYLT